MPKITMPRCVGSLRCWNALVKFETASTANKIAMTVRKGLRFRSGGIGASRTVRAAQLQFRDSVRTVCRQVDVQLQTACTGPAIAGVDPRIVRRWDAER